MSLNDLKDALAQLPPEDLVRFRAWFERLVSEKWDERIEADVTAGRLDHLVAEADREFEAGRCEPI